MAKKVIKAIELGKMHKEQLDLCQETIKIKDNFIENQKVIISTQEQQKENYKLAVEQQVKTIAIQDKIISKEKRKTNIWKIIAVSTASLFGASLVVK